MAIAWIRDLSAARPLIFWHFQITPAISTHCSLQPFKDAVKKLVDWIFVSVISVMLNFKRSYPLQAAANAFS